MSQPNVTCTPLVDNCLTDRGGITGLTMNVAGSLLSLGSLLYMFCFIAYAHRHTFKNGTHIFYNDMDIFIVSLLCAEFVQSISSILNVKWLLDGIVKVGPFCDAQGILTVIGDTGVALSTLLVGIYTFSVILTGRRFKSMTIALGIVIGIWALAAIPVGIGHGVTSNSSKSRFISPTPQAYWCWVSSDYLAWRIASECMWLWMTLFILPLLYIPLYLWMRGNLVFHNSVLWYRWTLQSRKFSDPSLHSVHRSAWIMLLYPAVYYSCIFPISLVRWIGFVRYSGTIPLAANFFATTIFNLSGFFNVILIFSTKPKLGIFGQQDSGRPPSSVNQFRPEIEPEVVGLPTRRLYPQA